MSVYAEFDTLTLQELSERFEAPPPPEEGDGVLYFDESARAIASRDADGIPYLWQKRADVDAPRRRGNIAALSTAPGEVSSETQSWLRNLLRSAEPMITSEATELHRPRERRRRTWRAWRCAGLARTPG